VVISTAAKDEAKRSAWCREQGIDPSDLKFSQEVATAALSQPEEGRASSAQTLEDRKRIKQLEREVKRKDKALRDRSSAGAVKKSRGDLRQQIAVAIEQARSEGARLEATCEVVGIDARTLQRWKVGDGLQSGAGARRPSTPPLHMR